jgi:NAD(P)-dependent dehydrogenase (short-subunit alcohol dehydrogenase family)
LDLELRDKVAIVTGGNRGIGKAVAWQLAKEGGDVALIARDRTALETAAAEIARATNRRLKGYVADAGDDAAVKAAVAQAFSDFGRVDILVNCAADDEGRRTMAHPMRTALLRIFDEAPAAEKSSRGRPRSDVLMITGIDRLARSTHRGHAAHRPRRPGGIIEGDRAADRHVHRGARQVLLRHAECVCGIRMNLRRERQLDCWG